MSLQRCKRCNSVLPANSSGICPACIMDAQDEPVVIGGDLELLEELGHGGMGTVYRARHLRLNRAVAVKFLPEELAGQAEFQARFEREARALALLNHPHIVTVHDFGRDGDQNYLVMELVEGGTLSKLIPLPVERALEIAIQICDALGYAHRQGVVHRDIKPENVLLDRDGRVKVSDFGLARINYSDSIGNRRWTITTPDVAVGTPNFMAPEAMAGASPDPRMDIYSLGVLLYELVSGRLPIGDFTPAPEGLDPVIRKCLAPDPQRRYASAEGLRRDLVSLQQRPLRDSPVAAALPLDETLWVRAAAMTLSVSTAVALWAFVECTRPKVLSKADLQPLVMLGGELLPDGRLLSRARFEIGPVLAAMTAFAVAVAAYGLLRRHWRQGGIEQATPGIPVPEARGVFVCGIASTILWLMRVALLASMQGYEQHAATAYTPLLGGTVLVIALFYLWLSLLQCWRTSRPVRREPRIWLGFFMAVLPPIVELLVYLRNWRP